MLANFRINFNIASACLRVTTVPRWRSTSCTFCGVNFSILPPSFFSFALSCKTSPILIYECFDSYSYYQNYFVLNCIDLYHKSFDTMPTFVK